MEIVQTLYLSEGTDPYKDGCGWVKPEYNAMSWALSCLQLKKVYGNVTLYANKPAASFLLDELHLPYENVVIFPESYILPHPGLWALPKIWTYSLQQKPFLHIDGDVFLFDKLSEDLVSGDVVGQNIEVATEYYTSMQREIEEHFTYFPDVVKNDFAMDEPIRAINAGILGGNDIELFKEYTAEALRYIDRNTQHFPVVTVDHFNVFFEQHLLYVMAMEKHSNIKLKYNDIIEDKGYSYIGNIMDTPRYRDYVHLLGHFKKDEFTCQKMSSKFRELYPDVYEGILKQYRDRNVFLEKFPVSLEHKCDFGRIDRYYSETDKNSFDDEDRSIMQDEYTDLKNRIKDVVQHCDLDYVQKVDLCSVRWYEKLIAPNKSNVVIEKTLYNVVMESKFDWGGLVNYYERVGVEYYLDWKFSKGEFYNLIVPEISETGFSLYDIDDIEAIILNELDREKSIEELKLNLMKYVVGEPTQKLIEKFNSLIFESLKRLVLYKAVKIQ